MRRPITDAQLEKITVTGAEEATMRRRISQLSAHLDRMGLAHNPITGVGLVRVACQGASLIGLPREDVGRFIALAIGMFPTRGEVLVLPTREEMADVLPMCGRLSAICNAAFRHDPIDALEMVAQQLMVGTAFMRFCGYEESTVWVVFDACWIDAENATAAVGQRGPKA